jgi:regulatory protein
MHSAWSLKRSSRTRTDATAMTRPAKRRGVPLAPSDLPVAERRQKAADAALRLLAVRDRSAMEIRTRLRDKGYDAETIVFVLDGLQTQGLQDDRRFADAFSGSAVRTKGLAGRVIQGELRRRGVDKEVAAIAATRSPEEEARTARAVAAKRVLGLRNLPPPVRARRLLSFLRRRGYSFQLCSDIVQELIGPFEGEAPAPE